ncbi:hypothetical protein ES708_11092 [subsurface metagenome]
MEKEIKLTDGVVLLRPYGSGDVERLYQAARESITEMSPWMPWCHADYSIEESRAWLELRAEAWEKGTEYEFVITDAKDGSFLGGCGLNHIDYKNRIANIGYWVRTSRTKRDVASAAVRLLAQFGFKKLKLNRIEVKAAVGNKASQRVAEKIGAKREGILRNRMVVRDRVYDMVMFSLIPEDLNLSS